VIKVASRCSTSSQRGNKAVEEAFVLGLDLDGCVANFIDRMRQIYAEWSGKDVASLDPDPTYGFTEWGLVPGEYDRLHRFAVTQRDLFSSMEPLPGAEGLRIRIATHRLFISYFHEPAPVNCRAYPTGTKRLPRHRPGESVAR
jgi:hypothetical protein